MCVWWGGGGEGSRDQLCTAAGFSRHLPQTPAWPPLSPEKEGEEQESLCILLLLNVIPAVPAQPKPTDQLWINTGPCSWQCTRDQGV